MELFFHVNLEEAFLFARARTRIYSKALALVAALLGTLPALSFAAALTFGQASSDLKSTDLAHRYAAVQAMKNFGPQGAVPALTAVLLSEKNIEVQVAMLDALSTLHNSAAVPAIAPLLSAKTQMVRQSAAYAIGLLGGPRAEGFLAAALPKETDTRVRTTELQGLSVCGSARSVAVIQSALEDPKAEVRVHAIEALRSIPGQAATEALKAHTETDPKLRQRVKEVIQTKQNGAS